MPTKKAFQVLSVLAIAMFISASLASAQTVNFLHSFADNGQDGFHPWAGLIFDAAGNLYGTTERGGTHDVGTVFKLSPNADGSWTETILHSFAYDGIDGYDLQGSLILDSAGNIYGTTAEGGLGQCTNPFGVVIGCGTVFKLEPSSGGSYIEHILYNFKTTGDDGFFPVSGLIFDEAGNLYGTTEGSFLSYGTVFELSPSAGGVWKENILWRFNKTDGEEPRAGLIFDSAGNLYGTTQFGGAHSYGTVYELSPSSNGTWTETVLHSFNLTTTELAYPEANLIFDAAGNLYSTTSYGTLIGGGGVFELSPSSGGTWTETILYAFDDVNGSDGYNSWSPLIFDASGNLYGTTGDGGTGQCKEESIVIGCGVIFKLTPSADGTWTESIVYNFDFTSNNNPEGPQGSGLMSDGKGNFYGTTWGGGTTGHGTIFEFTP
jgi:uncharacterized repeat protein (TIGR03803 family)